MIGVPRNYFSSLAKRQPQRSSLVYYKSVSRTPGVRSVGAFSTGNSVSRPKSVCNKDDKVEVVADACEMYKEMYENPSPVSSSSIADNIQEPRRPHTDIPDDGDDDDVDNSDIDLLQVLASKARGDDDGVERKRVDEQLFRSKLKSPALFSPFGTTPSTANTKIIRPAQTPKREKDDDDSDVVPVNEILAATPPPPEPRRSKRKVCVVEIKSNVTQKAWSPPRKLRPRIAKPVILPPVPEDLKEFYESLGFENHSTKQKTDKFGPLKITGADLHTLRRNVFTNDTIIDEYLKLICKRSQNDDITYRKCHAISSYFHASLLANGQQVVRSWVKANLFEYELVFVPLNSEEHWYLFVVDMVNRTMFIYDSIYNEREVETNRLRDFFKWYIGEDIDWSDWATIPVDNQQGPLQTNSTDCGVFVCQYAEYLSRGVNPDFVQSMMPNFRLRMKYELMKGELLPPPAPQPR